MYKTKLFISYFFLPLTKHSFSSLSHLSLPTLIFKLKPGNLLFLTYPLHRLPRWHSGKESACQCKRCRKPGFDTWVRKIPWRRKWHPTSVFFPGKSHGQRSLVGYSPWGRKKLDMTERPHFHFPHFLSVYLNVYIWWVHVCICLYVR